MIFQVEPDEYDESNWSTEINYSDMNSITSMSGVEECFDLTRSEQSRLESRIEKWIDSNKDEKVYDFLKTLDFDVFFEKAKELSIYDDDNDDNEDIIHQAKKDFSNETGGYHELAEAIKDDDNEFYKQLDEWPPGESDFFEEICNNDARELHEEYPDFAVNDNFVERTWEPQTSGENDYSEVYRALRRYVNGASAWVIEEDGSLGENGVEIISPPIDIADIESTIEDMRTFAEDEDFTTNDDCGLHINVSVPNFSHSNLDYLKLCLLVGDQHVLEKFGRDTNTYCKSSLGKIRDVFSADYIGQFAKSKIIDHLHNTLSTQSAIKFSDLRTLAFGITAKYSSIGIKDNRIEFRSVGGDWLSRDPTDVLEMVYRFTYCLYAACNPQVEKKEYAKKLYKFLGQFSSDTSAPMLSSLVISGEMNAKEAIAKIKAKSSITT
jgi:hypothetical protein